MCERTLLTCNLHCTVYCVREGTPHRGVIYSCIGIYAEVSAVAVERTVITLLGFLYHTLADIYSISTFLVTCGCGPDHCLGQSIGCTPGGTAIPNTASGPNSQRREALSKRLGGVRLQCSLSVAARHTRARV